MKGIRRFVFNSIMSDNDPTFIRQPIDLFLIILIILNVTAVIIETVPSIGAEHHDFFISFENFSVAIFSIEYLCRLYSCVEDQRYKGWILGRIKFAVTPMQIVDALAILPFFLSSSGVDARILRVLRIMRIFRLLKLARYIESTASMSKVLKDKGVDIIVSLFMIGMLVIISSSFMYFAERDIQPEVFSSIPAAMWWAVATLTTVGYGDVYPVTPLGKLLASFIAILGIGAIAVPTGILSSAFSDIVKKNK